MTNDVILVTGGAGYVGSHTCLALQQAGYQPVVYDDLSRGYRWAVRFGPLEEGNILDTRRLIDAIVRHRPAAIIHFAALTYVGESVLDPALYYRNNIAGTLSILEAMRETNLNTIVFSSTAAVYGTPSLSLISEDAALLPINPYGATKLAVERMLADFVQAYGFRAAALRYFNAAGADPEARIGEAHDPETHLIPLVLGAAAGHRKTISIFGSDYPTPDGTCIRDYIHVLDLADAHIRALTYMKATADAKFLALNLGTGQGTSVREVIDSAQLVTGRHIPLDLTARREGDPAILVADPSRAKKVLGWSAVRPSLETQIRDAWRWYQARFDSDSRATLLGTK